MKEATLANISELNYIPERILWLVDFYRKSVERKKFRLRESLICRDLSRGKESVCIAVENSVFDDAVIDAEEFTYVSMLNRPIFFTEQCDLSLVCQCTGLCSDNCFCTSRCPYTNDGCLSDEYIQLALNGNAGIIVECNQTCFCPSNCRSKVAQKGIKVRLQVYRTVKYGWAVKAVEKISKGQFICEYTGNAIEPAELDDNCDDSYIFEVQEGFYIDAKSCGNVSRFINHSCDANLVMAHAVWDIYTQHTPHICFYARNEINEGDELTLDYGKVWWKAKAGTIVCQCNSEVCRYNSVEKFDMNFL